MTLDPDHQIRSQALPDLERVPSPDELVEALYKDIRRALGLHPNSWASRVLLAGLRPAASRFARYALEFDRIVADRGFPAAADWASSLIFRQVRVLGTERVPTEGPLLIASNHPGTADSLAITAALNRKDLKIIASNMPVIRNLPFTSRHVIFASLPGSNQRMVVIREAVRHLKENGALLIFPSGRVDPDPSVLSGAETTFDYWSSSIGLMLRSVPETRVQVCIASGVLAPLSLRNPLSLFQRGKMEKQRAAEIFQTVQQVIFPRSVNLTANVMLGHPFRVSKSDGRVEAGEITQEIVRHGRVALKEHLEQWFGA